MGDASQDFSLSGGVRRTIRVWSVASWHFLKACSSRLPRSASASSPVPEVALSLQQLSAFSVIAGLVAQSPVQDFVERKL